MALNYSSYLKIDNKPVLYAYHLTRLIEDLGGEDKVRQAMDRLRGTVINQGFDGLVLSGTPLSTGLRNRRCSQIGANGCNGT